MTRARDLDATLDGLLAIAVAALGADAAAFYLVEPEEGELRLVASRGLPDASAGHRLRPGEGLLGRVASEARSLVSDDVTVDPRARHRREDWDADPPVRGFLGVPLRAGPLVLGALELTSRRPAAFGLEARGRASVLADAAALLIEQTRLTTQPPPAALGPERLGGGDPIGVATLDRRLAVTTANATFARLVGLPLEAMVGRSAIAVLPALGRPRARDALEAALRGAPGYLGGVHAVGEGGRQETLTLSLIPIGDPATGAEGVLVSVHDVSERARLEAELHEQHARALEARDRLRAVVAIVSHELRTPLTSVLGYARLLVDRPAAPEERRVHWAALVLEKARMMARLVDDVTDLARLGSERFELRRAPTDVGALARDVVAGLAATSARHTLEADVAADLPPVRVDRDRVEQVLSNLLTNAVKFWPEGGAVVVRVRPEAGGVAVDVEDRGPGIPPEDAERVFEPFYRVGGEGDRAVPGSGIGLAVSRGIVEAHGGRLWYEPNPGGGSRFRFVLPGEE